MKRFFTVFTVSALTLALSAGLFAQGAGPKGGGVGQQKGQEGRGFKRGKMNQEFMAKLNLTPDQKKKIDALQKSTQEKMKALMGNGGAVKGDRTAMREKFKPIMDAHKKAMKEILTPEQEKKLEAMRKEMRSKRGGPGGKGGPPKGGGG